MDSFAVRLAALMAERGVGVRALARRVPCNHALISRYLSGERLASPGMATRLDVALEAGGELVALAARAETGGTGSSRGDAPDDEIAALELTRRASASDIGAATIGQLEQTVDALAIGYPATPPAALLARVRSHLSYVGSLLDRRKTLAEHQRLLNVGAWLSLLAATCLTDLHGWEPAMAHLRTAVSLARETGHTEITAWCLETRAWQALITGEFRRAVSFAQAAQRAAPREGSAGIQATAQEGRALARLGAARETRDALGRTEALVSPLPQPDFPEHHFRYDPAKAEAYVATTLSWLGDPGAVQHIRQVLARIESTADGTLRPRRAASARLDLALALTTTGELDEAVSVTLGAVTSGLLVPSNYWRADEVITSVAGRDASGADELTDAYRQHCLAAHPGAALCGGRPSDGGVSVLPLPAPGGQGS